MKRWLPCVDLKWEKGWCKWLLLLAAALVLVGCRQDPLAGPMQRVKVDMLRDEAIAALEHEALYYQSCPNAGSIDDLFFFGSHSWDRAVVLIVVSARSGQEYRVIDVASFDEANAWHTAYARCLQRDRFAP